VEEILHEVADWKADWVVICTHGWTGVRHLLLGSVAERVVRLCTVPVLTIRAAS
jgi:nucleotide-binding universal stress UspA family protein